MKILLSLPLIILLSCSSSQSNQVGTDSSLNIFEFADSTVKTTMDRYQIPGISLGIVKEGKLIYSKGYGVKNVKTKDPVTVSSLFHAASISKLFTAQAIMLLIDEDKVKLDDKLIKILPDITFSDDRVEKVTIKMMLNHTSGIKDVIDYEWETQNRDIDALQSYVFGLNLSLKFDPGTEYAYSNLAYDILGRVVEVKTGVSFDEFQKNEILLPTGMKTSDFRYFRIPDSLKTSPHSKSKLLSKVSVIQYYPYNRAHAPSSTLNTSGQEMGKWMEWYMKKLDDNGPNSRYKQMIEPSFADYTGLGFQLFDVDGAKAVGHFGGDDGFRSLVIMIPEKKAGIAILGNAEFNDDYRTEIVKPILLYLMKAKE